MSVEMQTILNYCHRIGLYPPSEMYAGLVNPTPKQKKAEVRIMKICEDLYRIDNSTLSNMRNAVREFEVVMMMSESYPVKPTVVIHTAATALAHICEVLTQATALAKKDQELSQYYSSHSINSPMSRPIVALIKPFVTDWDDWSNACKEAHATLHAK